MDEDIWLENRLWPWLADDCMADECEEPFDDEPWYFCTDCLCGLDNDTLVCPDCGRVFEN